MLTTSLLVSFFLTYLLTGPPNRIRDFRGRTRDYYDDYYNYGRQQDYDYDYDYDHDYDYYNY